VIPRTNWPARKRFQTVRRKWLLAGGPEAKNPQRNARRQIDLSLRQVRLAPAYEHPRKPSGDEDIESTCGPHLRKRAAYPRSGALRRRHSDNKHTLAIEPQFAAAQGADADRLGPRTMSTFRVKWAHWLGRGDSQEARPPVRVLRSAAFFFPEERGGRHSIGLLRGHWAGLTI